MLKKGNRFVFITAFILFNLCIISPGPIKAMEEDLSEKMSQQMIISQNSSQDGENDRAKERDLKTAARSYFVEGKYLESGQIWDQLEEFRHQQNKKHLTLEEARQAAQAYQFAGVKQKECNYLNLIIKNPSHTNEDTLKWAKALWKYTSCIDPDPNWACWGVMNRTEPHSKIYNQAVDLFQQYNPKKLQWYRDRKIKRDKIDIYLAQKFTSLFFPPNISFQDIFERLKKEANAAAIRGQPEEEGEYWEATGHYAIAIRGLESKFCVKTIDGKTKNITIKEDEVWCASVFGKEGFRKALLAYRQANNTQKIAEMWDLYSKVQKFSDEEIREAANAQKQARNFKKEFEFRDKLLRREFKDQNDLVDALDLARCLWETCTQIDLGTPEGICWSVMQEKWNLKISNQAHALFQKYNPETLEALLKGEKVVKQPEKKEEIGYVPNLL